MSSIQDNLKKIEEKIRAVIKKQDKDNLSIPKLVAVSKRQPDNKVEQSILAGHRVFGENRVQEAKQRWQTRKMERPDLELHLIGPLQTNKVPDAVMLFDYIEVVDRMKLAKSLAAEMLRQGRHLKCFVQVNTGEESQKAGVLPGNTDEFVRFCRGECGLNIVGLMCIPPVDEEPAMHFALLREMAKRNNLSELSMGMSSDFEIAITFGATSVRVGSAIFGDREQH